MMNHFTVVMIHFGFIYLLKETCIVRYNIRHGFRLIATIDPFHNENRLCRLQVLINVTFTIILFPEESGFTLVGEIQPISLVSQKF